MWRFLVVLLVCAGLVPLIPQFVEGRFGPDRTSGDEEQAAAGQRTHRVAADRRGQFVADVSLNGRSVEMLIDTGATITALPASVADKAGIFLQDADFRHKVATANGETFGARVMIDRLRIGNVSLRDTEAIVLRDESLSIPLLGMTALNRLDRFDFLNGTLVLVQ